MCKQGTTTTILLAKPDKKGHLIAGVDSCIAPLVQLLNNIGKETVASCCGHGKQPSSIIFRDNTEIRIMTFEQARIVDKLFPPIN